MPKTSRILLTTFGSFGDLHPYMALGLELKRRGHTAVIGASEIYREKIESAGLSFHPIRPDMPAGPDTEDVVRRAMRQRGGTETVIREVVIANIRDSYTDTFAAAESCDLIVSHGLTYSSPIVAEQMGLPWVYTALSPIMMLSAHDLSSPPSLPWAHLFRFVNPWLLRKVIDSAIRGMDSWAEPIHHLRSELGLPRAESNPIVGAWSPHLNVALFSSHFAPPAEDWPERTVQPGFAFYDAYDSTQQQVPLELEAFLDAGSPPIVFTLGTAAVRDAGNFFNESVQAARLLKQRAVLLTGAQTGNELGLQLNRDSIAVPYAPYAELFPRAVVNVHQGGIGTTAQALRAGRPMLIMPYAHDQPDNAARCRRLRVSLSIPRTRYNSTSAAKAIRLLLDQREIALAAERIGKEISAERGTAQACDEIERIL